MLVISEGSLNMDDLWNRCDVCGKFVSPNNFIHGKATRRLITPDSELSREEFETC